MRIRYQAAIFGIVVAVVSASAFACGESLFRVGKGVPYRQYTAPLPGHIIAVANTDAELAMTERLAAAGHHVHVVSTPGEATAALAERPFDIVLAYYSQRDQIAAQAAAAAVTYIPVAIGGTEEVPKAAAAYDYSLASDDNVKTFLKTIHRSLKSRG